MSNNEVGERELVRVRDWANSQLAKGEEQPWSAFLLTRLAETIDALLAGRAESRAAKSSDTPLRLVVSNSSQTCKDPD